MSEPDLRLVIEIHDATDWLSGTLPAWATRTRFHARTVERDGVIVLTAKDTSGAVGYAVLDKQMFHLHYIETREDCRRRGVASRLWARVRELTIHSDVTATTNTEDGKRRLAAWGFREADGMWTWKTSR